MHYIRGDTVIAKFIRYTLLGILAVTLLAVGALASALFVIDPNAYKGQLEKLAEDNSRLRLELAGDISWSLQPLGFELHDVNAELDGESFLTLNSIVAKADLWSLLRWQPRVQTFVLRGLKTTLVVDEQGEGNWQRILKDEEKVSSNEAAEDTGANGTLQFNIREIVIEGARVHYSDRRNNQSLLLDDINITATDSGFDAPFPLQLAFRFANADIGVRAKLSTQVTVDAALQHFDISALSGSAELSGAALNHQTVNSSIAADLNADLEKSQASVRNLDLRFANLRLQGQLDVEQFDSSPAFNGKLTLAEFSLRQLQATLGQAAIDSADPTVLTKLSLTAQLSGTDQAVTLKPFKLIVDDTSIAGDLAYHLDSSRLTADLQATALNLDRYLPAPVETETGAPEAAAAAPETDLLPLETLRTLNWDLRLGLKQLIANGLTLNDLQLHSTAASGLLRLEQLSGRLYDGSLQASAQVDARTDTPLWQLKPQLSGVQTGPLLKDLADVTLLSGAADVSADIQTRGNRVSALRSQAKGNAQLAMAKGVIDGVSTSAMACEAIALINKEAISTRDWPRSTEFTDLKGQLLIEGNTLNNTALSARVAGLELGGSGTVQLDELLLKYRAGLTVAGPIHEDPACRINDKLLGLRIPAKCQGPLAAGAGADSGSLCSFDSAAFGDTVEDLAKAELKRKAKKKAEQKIDKLLGTEEGTETDPRKEAFKGLLKELGR